jgi:hypothetical protein
MLVVGTPAPIPAFPQTGEGDARTDGFSRRSTNKSLGHDLNPLALYHDLFGGTVFS